VPTSAFVPDRSAQSKCRNPASSASLVAVIVTARRELSAKAECGHFWAGSVIWWNSRHPQIRRFNHDHTSKLFRRAVSADGFTLDAGRRSQAQLPFSLNAQVKGRAFGVVSCGFWPFHSRTLVGLGLPARSSLLALSSQQMVCAGPSPPIFLKSIENKPVKKWGAQVLEIAGVSRESKTLSLNL